MLTLHPKLCKEWDYEKMGTRIRLTLFPKVMPISIGGVKGGMSGKQKYTTARMGQDVHIV